MRFSDTKEFYFETFGFVTVETFWLEGLIEINENIDDFETGKIKKTPAYLFKLN